ncbi:MAG TPA: hypothetical protein VMY37_04345 [Thermoguttaceae bacterium]|nr:hypothetical protein [Thermoguttaceae bacterium]
MKKRTRKAIRECAEALQNCLTFGWSKSSLDKLEDLWWRCHLPNGKVMSPEEYKAAKCEAAEAAKERP